MENIIIVSSSVRTGRNSHRAAIYLEKYLNTQDGLSAKILDLDEYNFPVFDERLRFQKNPSKEMLEVSGKIKDASGVILVTPEYNGGYPASLKNFIDLLYDEWYHKPVAIVSASSGAFGGAQVTTSLVFTMWKIKAWVIPYMFLIPKIQDAFNERGEASEKENMDKRAEAMLKELNWAMKAVRNLQ